MSERIVINPDICNGRPVVRGTRIAVQTVLEFLAAGDPSRIVVHSESSCDFRFQCWKQSNLFRNLGICQAA